ncbi:MAG: radical SAM protein [Bacteroidales bacterium]|nr:radical SAM protein [Bacteroidales bacterium]
MPTFLFDKIIFGPVWSRRLGESLGINLLPVNRKACTFNCIYCECGLTPAAVAQPGFPEAKKVLELLEEKLTKMKAENQYLNSITFAGNGEPTLHPQFPLIIEESIGIRNKLYPKANITVLSNATTSSNPRIIEALLKADLNILKLDSAVEETVKLINCPAAGFHLRDLINTLRLFKGNLIIQTLFFRGHFKGVSIDNTSEAEVSAWIAALNEIKPESVMIYSLARDTAVEGLEAIGFEELNAIAEKAEKSGFRTQVTP